VLENENLKDVKIIYDASKPTMIPKRLIDNTKAKEILGFEARTSLAEGIKKTVDWYRSTIKNN